MRAPPPASVATQAPAPRLPPQAPSAAFPAPQLAPFAEGLQFWQAGSTAAVQAMLEPLLASLALHFRVVFVALAEVAPPAVLGGPVYRISTVLPNVLAEVTRTLSRRSGRPVVVCLVTTGLETRLSAIANALPAGIGGVAFGVSQGGAGLPSVAVAPTANGWSFRSEHAAVEVPLRDGKFVVERPQSTSKTAHAPSSGRAAAKRSSNPTSLLSRVPAAPLVPGCIPAPSEGLAVWSAGSPAGVTSLLGPLLAQLAEHHRVLFVGPAASQPKPVRGGPVYTTSRLLPAEVGAAVTALKRQPGRPIAVCFAGSATERRLAEYATVLPAGIGGVALVPVAVESPLPQVKCEPRPEGWQLTGPLGTALVAASWRGLSPFR